MMHHLLFYDINYIDQQQMSKQLTHITESECKLMMAQDVVWRMLTCAQTVSTA